MSDILPESTKSPANQSTPEVTRADREAAAEWIARSPYDVVKAEAEMIRLGQLDHQGLVQAFARHRLAPATPARGGDELREALENHTRWLDEISTNTDMAEIVADGGVTAGMVVQQEARDQRHRLMRALASTDMAGAGEGLSWRLERIIEDGGPLTLSDKAILREAAIALATTPAVHACDAPIPMILHCPRCHVQHIDEPDDRNPGWGNPPHRSHLCHACGCIWRPADVPTEGVASIATVGKADTPLPPVEGMTSGEGAYAGASDAACTCYPGVDQVALRDAFCAGAAYQADGSLPAASPKATATASVWKDAPGERADHLNSRISPMAAAHLGYEAGFGDARGMAKQLAFQAHGICDLTRNIEAMPAISSYEFDGPEIYLAAALDHIDGEAPSTEPHDGPTVGFPPSKDPREDDGNDVVREAFEEGVKRGLWQAARIARAAISKTTGARSLTDSGTAATIGGERA